MSRLLCQAELLRRQAMNPQPSSPPKGDQQVRVSATSSPFTESNRRPSPYHGDALPTELKGRSRRSAYRLTLLLARVIGGSGNPGQNEDPRSSRPGDRAPPPRAANHAASRSGGSGRLNR